MKEVEYVKVVFSVTPVEPYLVSHSKEFVFKGEHFSNCETIEEIRDMVLEDTSIDRIEYIHIWTYKNREDMNKDKQFDYLGE